MCIYRNGIELLFHYHHLKSSLWWVCSLQQWIRGKKSINHNSIQCRMINLCNGQNLKCLTLAFWLSYIILWMSLTFENFIKPFDNENGTFVFWRKGWQVATFFRMNAYRCHRVVYGRVVASWIFTIGFWASWHNLLHLPAGGWKN